mmetsp:Transcript_55681/g.154114  ORF Transcript_55681/g.154114 Transcript_55681/m.154114 type:complete len:309 (-) Transcript_55681:1809-2735(-)
MAKLFHCSLMASLGPRSLHLLALKLCLDGQHGILRLAELLCQSCLGLRSLAARFLQLPLGVIQLRLQPHHQAIALRDLAGELLGVGLAELLQGPIAVDLRLQREPSLLVELLLQDLQGALRILQPLLPCADDLGVLLGNPLALLLQLQVCLADRHVALRQRLQARMVLLIGGLDRQSLLHRGSLSLLLQFQEHLAELRVTVGECLHVHLVRAVCVLDVRLPELSDGLPPLGLGLEPRQLLLVGKVLPDGVQLPLRLREPLQQRLFRLRPANLQLLHFFLRLLHLRILLHQRTGVIGELMAEFLSVLLV